MRIFAETYRQGADVQLGIGDDAALIDPGNGPAVVSSDMLVDGVDFELSWASFRDVGWKSVAVNLSDINAMGAQPTSLVVAIGVPSTVRLEQFEEFAQGAQSALDELAPSASIVGGDLSRAPVLTVSVTVYGTLAGAQPVRRSRAQVGDVVAYCGELGLAGAGLAVLQRGAVDAGASDLVRAAVAAQLRPRPPMGAGANARAAGATAMIDVSDGLGVDASRIADASGVTIAFDHLVFPARARGLAWTRFDVGLDPWALIFAGGEDFGVLATFPSDATLPQGFDALGVVTTRGEHAVVMRERPLDYVQWDHFSA